MFWRRKRPSADFTEEVRAHLQLEADELARRWTGGGRGPLRGSKSIRECDIGRGALL